MAEERGMGLKGWLSGPRSKTARPETLAEKPPSMDEHRIAVLPMANISPDPKDDYFADGLTEELISSISNISQFSVISRTSSMTFKGTGKKIREIGKELDVGSVLEGSVRKSGSRMRITVQLVDVRSDKHLWSQSYDREFSDVFAVQGDIARQVADALRVRIPPEETRQLEKKPTESSEAHSLYLKGRYFWNERVRDSIGKAVKYFEEAVKVDPDYALAYSGLADCYLIYSDRGWLAPRIAVPKGKEYALTAFRLDPRLAEVRASLGLVFMQEWKWQEAEKEFEKAIELNPSYSAAYNWYGVSLWLTGKYEEAVQKTERASELDPLSPLIASNLFRDLLSLGRRDEALGQFRRLTELSPDSWQEHSSHSMIHLMESRFEDAISESEKANHLLGENLGLKAQLGFVYGMGGRKEQAIKILDVLRVAEKNDYVPDCWIGIVLFGLGRRDEAFEHLDKALEERSMVLLYLRNFPWFEKIRTDPQWASLEKRIGIWNKSDV